MENFRKKMQKKVIIYGIITVVFAILMLILIIVNDNSSDVKFNIGIFSGVLTSSSINIVKIKKSLKDEKLFKEMYIRYTDERMTAVDREASRTAFNIIMVSVSLGLIISNYFNKTVSNTLAFMLGFIMLVYFGTSIYYNKKM